jgi:hypothetical protein
MVTERRVFTLITIVAAFAFVVLFFLIRDNNQKIELQVKRNNQTIQELQRTVKVLCDRGFIIDDLITGGISLIGQRLAQDIAEGNLQAVKADQRFLSNYVDNHLKIISELTKKGSPCATVP